MQALHSPIILYPLQLRSGPPHTQASFRSHRPPLTASPSLNHSNKPTNSPTMPLPRPRRGTAALFVFLGLLGYHSNTMMAGAFSQPAAPVLQPPPRGGRAAGGAVRMVAKRVSFGDKGLDQLVAGINIVGDAVKVRACLIMGRSSSKYLGRRPGPVVDPLPLHPSLPPGGGTTNDHHSTMTPQRHRSRWAPWAGTWCWPGWMRRRRS